MVTRSGVASADMGFKVLRVRDPSIRCTPFGWALSLLQRIPVQLIGQSRVPVAFRKAVGATGAVSVGIGSIGIGRSRGTSSPFTISSRCRWIVSLLERLRQPYQN
jgi:hypothetical protein